MAAESPRKSAKYNCNVVRPHQFSDKSVAESVFDFITDVVPQVSQAYTSTSPKTVEKEKITWIRFEDCDNNDLLSNPNLRGIEQKGRPLVIAVGYQDGVQLWVVCHGGEAMEVLSLRQGPVTCLRVLPSPDPEQDDFRNQRPLAAICDSSGAGKPFCGVKFVSLRSGDEVHSLPFKTLPVNDIECNKRFIVAVFREKLAVIDACRLRQLFWISGCYPCPGLNVNPIALGDRWLAYADKRLLPVHQSCGGMSGDGSQSYAATVISAAKGAFKGLTMFGEAMVSSVTGNKPTPLVKKPEPSQPDENGHRPGIVSVVDLKCLRGDQFYVPEDPDIDGLIAHFHAHANEPVAAMAFDPNGTLLVTACKLGHNFHVFSLVAHPCSSSLGAVHHLYTLHRGDTTAKVTDIAFTNDSRWVTVSTHRGTTHVFPITPYGGPVCVRTHCQARVVNRVSRFHKSAGLDEIDPGAAGRHSPVLSSSPGSSGPQEGYPSLIRQNALRNNTGNPRLPPYPHPTPVQPLAQLKLTLSIPGLGSTSSNSSSSHPQNLAHSSGNSPKDSAFQVCSVFAPQRTSALERRDHSKKTLVDSLFVLNQSGELTEYHLEPRPKPPPGQSEKHPTSDAPLDLEVKGRLQWNLQRSKSSTEVKPPLPANNPLRVATEAVQTQQPTYPSEPDLSSVTRYGSKDSLSSDHGSRDEQLDEQWVSQVEIITHVGPHRRLWMGPQFQFKTYANPSATTILSSSSSSLFSGSPDNNAHLSTMDIITDDCDLESLRLNPSRSSPVAMPTARPAYRRSSTSDRTTSPGRGSASSVPLYIEAGSYEQSPILSDVFSEWTESNIMRQPQGSEEEEDRLRRTLEEAMMDVPLAPTSVAELSKSGGRVGGGAGSAALGVPGAEDEEDAGLTIRIKEDYVFVDHSTRVMPPPTPPVPDDVPPSSLVLYNSPTLHAVSYDHPTSGMRPPFLSIPDANTPTLIPCNSAPKPSGNFHPPSISITDYSSPEPPGSLNPPTISISDDSTPEPPGSLYPPTISISDDSTPEPPGSLYPPTISISDDSTPEPPGSLYPPTISISDDTTPQTSGSLLSPTTSIPDDNQPLPSVPYESPIGSPYDAYNSYLPSVPSIPHGDYPFLLDLRTRPHVSLTRHDPPPSDIFHDSSETLSSSDSSITTIPPPGATTTTISTASSNIAVTTGGAAAFGSSSSPRRRPSGGNSSAGEVSPHHHKQRQQQHYDPCSSGGSSSSSSRGRGRASPDDLLS